MLKELAEIELPVVLANRYSKIFLKEIKDQIQDGEAFFLKAEDIWTGGAYLNRSLYVLCRFQCCRHVWPHGIFVRGYYGYNNSERNNEISFVLELTEAWKTPANRNYDELERLFYNILSHELRHYQQCKFLGLKQFRKINKTAHTKSAATISYFKNPLEIDAYSAAIFLTAKKYNISLRKYMDEYLSNIAFDMANMGIKPSFSDQLISTARRSWIQHIELISRAK